MASRTEEGIGETRGSPSVAESRGLRRHPPNHHWMDTTSVPMDDRWVVHSRLDARASRLQRRLRSTWRWRLRCRSWRPQVRRRCWHRTTPVHLHRLGVARRRRRRHRGHAWRSRRHRGRAWHVRRSWGRAWRSRDHRKRCRCTRRTCGKRTNRQRWLNHRVRRKQGLQLGVRGRCRGGGVREIRLVKHNVSGDEDPARGEVKAAVPLVVRGVTKKHTMSRAGCQLVEMLG